MTKRASATVVGLLFLGSCQPMPAWADQTIGYATYFTVASCRKEGNTGRMASGVLLRDSAYVCALPHRDFGRAYRVCLAEQPQRCTTVTHLDYGPGTRPRSRGVVVDLSAAAFLELSPLSAGKIKITLEPLE